MTSAEKTQREQAIRERLLDLSYIMSKSDAHASKCTKLEIGFKDTYPNEYIEYTSAREEYNRLEIELTNLVLTDTEEEFIDDINVVDNEQ